MNRIIKIFHRFEIWFNKKLGWYFTSARKQDLRSKDNCYEDIVNEFPEIPDEDIPTLGRWLKEIRELRD